MTFTWNKEEQVHEAGVPKCKAESVLVALMNFGSILTTRTNPELAN